MAKGRLGGANPLEQFGRLAPAQKVLVGIAVLIFVALGFYLGAYQEVDEAVAKQKRKRSNLEKTLSEYQVKLQNKQKFQEGIRELEKKRQTALEKLPEKAEIPALLSKIHGQAKIVGLDIKGFQRMDEVSQGFYSAIPVAMELSGTYHQIATFFYYIGKLTRIVNLTNISLDLQGTNKTDPVRLTGTVLATTFRYSPPKRGRGKKRR